ncbi:MAG: division/cell wall cluster transcriptional repressor MraZ [Planctomycetia bacterium]|nr:division/cell wall cluster transcriptional repressor MraZ [Planctomycetia bacterium]
MPDQTNLILGEYSRRLDDRFRLSLPGEILECFQPANGDCIIAKERPGCISLWDRESWDKNLDKRIQLIKQRLDLGDLEKDIPNVQMLGRLLSTRHRPVQLAPRGRLLLPEGFREYLRAEVGSELMIVGAAVCVEIWNPDKWLAYIEKRMPKFRKLITKLSGMGN